MIVPVIRILARHGHQGQVSPGGPIRPQAVVVGHLEIVDELAAGEGRIADCLDLELDVRWPRRVPVVLRARDNQVHAVASVIRLAARVPGRRHNQLDEVLAIPPLPLVKVKHWLPGTSFGPPASGFGPTLPTGPATRDRRGRRGRTITHILPPVRTYRALFATIAGLAVRRTSTVDTVPCSRRPTSGGAAGGCG
ncbi:hypothetical protein FAIPA1_100073 [Frankia sp. AiPs1]